MRPAAVTDKDGRLDQTAISLAVGKPFNGSGGFARTTYVPACIDAQPWDLRHR